MIAYAKEGSIPACAGEPDSAEPATQRLRFYPRVCGGTRDRHRMRRQNEGLSPRVRGNLHRTNQPGHPFGSSPACAGEPGSSLSASMPMGVYPRVCGGTWRLNVRSDISKGLSPRVRGNHTYASAADGDCGSIPACAGEPEHALIISMNMRVYPRVCGGTSMRNTPIFSQWGLSPRVRGNRAAYNHRCRGTGSIPACAGEPPELLCPAP